MGPGEEVSLNYGELSYVVPLHEVVVEVILELDTQKCELLSHFKAKF